MNSLIDCSDCVIHEELLDGFDDYAIGWHSVRIEERLGHDLIKSPQHFLPFPDPFATEGLGSHSKSYYVVGFLFPQVFEAPTDTYPVQPTRHLLDFTHETRHYR